MNQTVLPQLQTIEAELASQESQLSAQLASVQEKLSGIRAVMPMFLEAADSTAESVAGELPSVNGLVEDVATSEESEEEPIAEQPTVPEASESTAEPTAEFTSEFTESEFTESEFTETEAAEATELKKTAEKKAAAQKKPTVKKASTEKPDGRAAAWQMYTRPGVKNESIPDAVRLILATQPENDFKIADVMEALFQADMPHSHYLKARNRISNVLSGGVRAGDWHKGDRGTYRMTAV